MYGHPWERHQPAVLFNERCYPRRYLLPVSAETELSEEYHFICGSRYLPIVGDLHDVSAKFTIQQPSGTNDLNETRNVQDITNQCTIGPRPSSSGKDSGARNVTAYDEVVPKDDFSNIRTGTQDGMKPALLMNHDIEQKHNTSQVEPEMISSKSEIVSDGNKSSQQNDRIAVDSTKGSTVAIVTHQGSTVVGVGATVSRCPLNPELCTQNEQEIKVGERDNDQTVNNGSKGLIHTPDVLKVTLQNEDRQTDAPPFCNNETMNKKHSNVSTDYEAKAKYHEQKRAIINDTSHLAEKNIENQQGESSGTGRKLGRGPRIQGNVRRIIHCQRRRRTDKVWIKV